MRFSFLKNFFFIVIALSSCYIPKNYQKGKPFVAGNTVKVNGGNFSSDDRSSLEQRLVTLVHDSMKTKVKDVMFLLHFLQRPPAYDSGYAEISSSNIRASMIHLGYYRAEVKFKADTAAQGKKEKKVTVKYFVEAGPPTLIDTVAWLLKDTSLQQLSVSNKKQSFLVKPNPITKTDVLSEISRLVELYRNNGYYKFTPDDIRVRGDTSIDVLTNVSGDPFENLRLLAEANEKRNKPTIKLGMVQNPASDSQRFKQYMIGDVIIYPDFTADDVLAEPDSTETAANGTIIRWFRKPSLIKKILLQSLVFKKGSLYSQEEYNRTIANFSRMGVWQNVNIQPKERKDSSGMIDMIIQLVPAKKYGFETNIEASYSASSNTNVSSINAGNLLGLSGNISIQNRNTGRSGVKMTLPIRAGIELNLGNQQQTGRKINSSEISFNPTFSFPYLMGQGLSKCLFTGAKTILGLKISYRDLVSGQTVLSSTLSATNRIQLFKLFSLGGSYGYDYTLRGNKNLQVKLVNVEYSNLYNRTEAFDEAVKQNPFLRYSFNTALVMGFTASYSESHAGRRDWIISQRRNLEVSVYRRRFVKFDIERTWLKNIRKSTVAFRLFGGFGYAFGGDTTLPFFKQYFAGGPNSMRGWPVRGIGPGSKTLASYTNRTLNDRTGDVRIELNGEWRFHIKQIIPNTLALKGALFADVGNVWNMRNTNPGGGFDSTQFPLNPFDHSAFSLKNFYNQLGVNVGTGFRFDFTYIVLRIDFGFRIKRPELSENGGWKIPSLGFNDVFKKFFKRGDNDEYRKWRYENFNFTIGLNYAF